MPKKKKYPPGSQGNCENCGRYGYMNDPCDCESEETYYDEYDWLEHDLEEDDEEEEDFDRRLYHGRDGLSSLDPAEADYWEELRGW